MYECKNCGIRWTPGFVPTDNIHICKLCGKDCRKTNEEEDKANE